jgi:ATP-dependent RNA helicase SUPV3L1/SUV3
LTLFRRNIDVNDVFFVPTALTEQSERAKWLDGMRLPLAERFLFSIIPIATRIPKFQDQLWAWANAVENRRQSRIQPVGLRQGRSSLQDAEDACKIYSGYAWLAQRMPEHFPDGPAAVELALEASALVHQMLRAQNRGGKKRADGKKTLTGMLR